jgi:hypothetical protein
MPCRLAKPIAPLIGARREVARENAEIRTPLKNETEPVLDSRHTEAALDAPLSRRSAPIRTEARGRPAAPFLGTASCRVTL